MICVLKINYFYIIKDKIEIWDAYSKIYPFYIVIIVINDINYIFNVTFEYF